MFFSTSASLIKKSNKKKEYRGGEKDNNLPNGKENELFENNITKKN